MPHRWPYPSTDSLLQELTERIQTTVKVEHREHVVFSGGKTWCSKDQVLPEIPVPLPMSSSYAHVDRLLNQELNFLALLLQRSNLSVFSLSFRGSLNQKLRYMKWNESQITLVPCNPLCLFFPNSADYSATKILMKIFWGVTTISAFQEQQKE